MVNSYLLFNGTSVERARENALYSIAFHFSYYCCCFCFSVVQETMWYYAALAANSNQDNWRRFSDRPEQERVHYWMYWPVSSKYCTRSFMIIMLYIQTHNGFFFSRAVRFNYHFKWFLFWHAIYSVELILRLLLLRFFVWFLCGCSWRTSYNCFSFAGLKSEPSSAIAFATMK